MHKALTIISWLATLPVLGYAHSMPREYSDTLSSASVTRYRTPWTRSSTPLQTSSASRLQLGGAVSLHEALKTFAGISVKDYGGIGGLKTVSVRSFGAQHTGISYDGIVVSDAQSGQVDIGRFNLDDVSSLSVEIGGSDDIFRSARLAAAAGVLNIVSLRPVLDSTGIQVTAQMRMASFGTVNPYFSIRHRIGRPWTANAWMSMISSQGDYPFTLYNGSLVTQETRLNSDVRSITAEYALYGPVDFRLSYHGSERGLPGSVILYTQNPTERLWDHDFRASGRYENSISQDLRFKADLSYNLSHNRYLDDKPTYPEPHDDRYLQHETSLNAVAMWSTAELLSISLSEDLVVNALESSIPGSVDPVRETSYTALSAKFGRGNLTAVGTILATMYAEQARIGDHKSSGVRVSPSASISYGIGDFRLRVSARESFRMPTFNDIYYPRIGNRNLAPEKAWQSNFGLTWAGDIEGMCISATADAYCNLVRDKIVAIPGLFTWSMRNVGRVFMSGADLTADIMTKATGGLTTDVRATYSYQYAVDITDPQAKNYRHQIAYTPRHSGSLSMLLGTRWMNIGYTLQAVGERYSLAQNTAAYLVSSYCDHTVSASHDIHFGKAKAKISADVMNLADINYEIIKYYPMPGRSYRLTIKITY